ncbi:hypothetical protein B0H14DRAFT_3160744 [Mycena olivaceomarginata]|nr:hypothetical protein B0H14DRAFT_3160744 [Mycena olivaceomarginata]
MSRSLRNPGNGCRTRATSVPPLPSVRPSFPLLKFVKASKSVSRPPALGFRGVSTTTTFLGIVKEEVTDNRLRCRELIDKVVRRSETILSGLKKIAHLLGDVYAALVQCTSRKTRDRVDRLFNRGQLLDDMLRLERLLDDFRVNFSARSIPPNIAPQATFYVRTGARKGRHRLYPFGVTSGTGRDPWCWRDRENNNWRFLFCTMSRVVSRYDSRYFVACDGVTSAELLLTELANLDENMHDLVLASFRRDPGVLCFDNLETAWDNLEGRRAVEDLLMEFMAIPNLALLVTVRGTQRPAPSAGWSMPFLQPLHSLRFTDAVDVFRHISGGKMDEYAEKMIKEVDCIPLAVTLLGHMVQEENETTASLAKRWKKERTALIENGGDDRLSKLDKSIQCSVTSPRMQQDTSATNILALLSLLPDGFPNREGMLDKLQRFLPPDVNLRKAVLPELRTALVDLYVGILDDGRDYSDPHSHTFIPPELLNIRAVLAEAYRSGDRREALIKASIAYTAWLVFMGSGSEEIIQLAIQSMPDSDELLASCFYWLGKLCMRRNDVEEAHRAFVRAIELHVQAQDESGEAYDLYELGSLYIWWGKLEEAEGSFKRALELHTAKGDFLGEAYDLLDLGKLFMRRGQLEEAERSTSNALDLLREIHNVLGEAHAMRRLGGVYIRQDRLDEAEESFWEAVKLHRQSKSVLGEAHDMRRLGGLYMWRHQLDEAEICFTKAADLHRKSHDLLGEIQNVLGRANDMQNLGELYKRRNQVAEAQLSLTEAVELHRQSGDVMGWAKDMQKIGELYMQTGDLDEAEKALSSAVELHRQACNQVGEAYGLESLATLYRQRGEPWPSKGAFVRGMKPRSSSAGVLVHEDDLEEGLVKLDLRHRIEGSWLFGISLVDCKGLRAGARDAIRDGNRTPLRHFQSGDTVL